MLKDYYALLGLPQDATHADIKLQYQRLLLQHHPDKVQQRQEEAKATGSPVMLQDIKEAWECLREPAQRAFYDTSLKESGSYSTPCRCSGEYVISEAELELGVDTVVCSTCSLIVRIHYEVASDGDEED
ncbi:DnaJ sub C member 24 [Actinomortierella ambigua]|uniref:Diphthamide biosynthesis protein 4 n=1 Tax=Actinomortierella ambigua TaxID=1343610 RepID=A0A9P6U8Y1_9FUNG|nr:DnaJ sub C member 24 [Actinomortierella ambigua]